MAPRAPDLVLDARLKKIEKAQEEAAKKQEALEKQLKEQKEITGKSIEILQDNENALSYLQKYLAHYVAEANEQAMMLTSAITRFASFVDLPPTHSKLDIILDAAFTTLAAVVPLLRLAGIAKLETAANEWIALSKSTEVRLTVSTAQKVLSSVKSTQEILDAAKKANDSRTKLSAAMRDDASKGAIATLSKLDAARKPIKELIAVINQIARTFDAVADAISAEFNLRMAVPTIHFNETIRQTTERLLPLPMFPSQSELDAIGSLYLWNMISNYCRVNTKLVHHTGGIIEYVGIEGLNDNQQQALVEFFGFTAPHGFYFTYFVVTPRQCLEIMGVRTETEYDSSGRFRR